MPAATEYLWAWFIELGSSRTGSGFGPNPITYQELHAWATMTEAQPSPWDIEQIRAMDAAYLSDYAERADQNKTKAEGAT